MQAIALEPAAAQGSYFNAALIQERRGAALFSTFFLGAPAGADAALTERGEPIVDVDT